MSNTFIFAFDVTLKDLMNLGDRAKEVWKLQAIMEFLKRFWYKPSGDAIRDSHRWNDIRVGSVDVFLDDDKNLHLDFVTRFSLGSYPEIVELLEKLKAP